MVKSDIIKEISSSSVKHWKDINLTEKEDDKKAASIISNIENGIKKSKSMLKVRDTFISLSEITEDEPDFKFPTKYLDYSFASHYNYFSKTQKWIGNVIEIKGDEFTAKLIDQTNGGTNEIAEFSINDVSFDDRELLRLGSTFYFSIGYNSSSNGQISKSSVMRFQRLVKWEESNYDSALQAAEDAMNNLMWE